MLAERTWRKRRLLSRARSLIDDGRYVDFGIRVYVVKQDVDHGRPMRAGEPPVAALGQHEFGGVFDTVLGKFIEDSPNPVIWTLSEKQFPLAAHGLKCNCCGIEHGSELAPRLLVYGAMGAGKTRGCLAPWLVFRCIEHAGSHGEIGATAPTRKRLEMLRQALSQAMPPEWFTYHVADTYFRTSVGVTIRLQATKQASSDIGSPIQGWNWRACGSDEIQDSLEADSDIEARGRAAPGGRYKRINTATAKDSPAWRSWRDGRDSRLWGIARLDGPSNPFVWRSYWEDLSLTMDPRAYQRKVLAMDVGPERAVYPSWNRDESLRPVPRVGAVDVTRQALAAWGPNYDVLVGHDPGKLKDVSLILKAYKLPGVDLPVWWVVGEVTTPDTTTEQHVLELLKVLRAEYGCNELDRKGNPVAGGRVALVRADPYSNSGNDEQQPDRSVYTIFRRHHLDIRPAAYSQGGNKPGRIPKEAGIEMVNTLLCNASEVRRLYVACDDRRQPAAAGLVEALEMSERDGDGRAEAQKKDASDLSHWPAALRYALWAIERPRMQHLVGVV